VLLVLLLVLMNLRKATEFWWKAASLWDNIKMMLGMHLFRLGGAWIMSRGGEGFVLTVLKLSLVREH